MVVSDSHPQYDVVIIGGGMVGASLALALAPLSLRVAVVERSEPSLGAPPTYDDRAIALSYGSQRILRSIGLWNHLAPWATPIKKIHISEQGRFGFSHLDSAEESVPALGYVVLARELGNALYRALDDTPTEFFAPATLGGFEQGAQSVRLRLNEGIREKTVHAKLVVAADGTQSKVRALLGIETRRREYGQCAVITNVSTEKHHGNQAFERFTEAGPIALLPMTEGRCGLVWTWHKDEVQGTLDWNEERFLEELQLAFGYRLGRFTRVGARHAYPLELLMAEDSVRGRVVLVGNAMHTLHPIAGQGFNLGVRDVAALADVLADMIPESGAGGSSVDVGTARTLARYQQWRHDDQRNLATITDSLARLFGNPLSPVRLARNLGLVLSDILPGVRHAIARHAMGLASPMPRLSRGLPLTSSKRSLAP
jgi:2-octaprenyl-6-methoxyphenol hydroxylase